MTKIYEPLGAEKARVILIDHYDSFTYNLVQSLCGGGAQVTVVSHDLVTLAETLDPRYTHAVLSPGPGHPQRLGDFQIGRELLEVLPIKRPLLGVCLGMQGIAAHFGAKINRAPRVMHGKTSRVMHEGSGLFQGRTNPMRVMRYHSLSVETSSLPDFLIPTAWCPQDGVLMGLRHREWPLFGVQFHPESVGTPEGDALLSTFLSLAPSP